MTTQNLQIKGHATVSRDLTTGGKLSVNANATIRGNLRVGGWLDAHNVKTPCKGLFATADSLYEAYPKPLPGWWALVGDTLPAEIYISEAREWIATGNEAGEITISNEVYDHAIEAANDEISRLSAEVGTLESAVEEIEHPIEVKDTALGQLVIADANETPIATFVNGHIRTAKFDSAEISANDNTAIAEYDITMLPGMDAALASAKTSDGTASATNNHQQKATLLQITDVHGDTARTATAMKIAKALNATVVGTGDYVAYYSDDDFVKITQIINSNAVRYIGALGNHDTFGYTNEEVCRSKYFAPFEDTNSYTMGEEGTYAYTDLADHHLRLIAVNQYQTCATKTGMNYHIHQQQATFLQNALYTLPQGYGAIILMHTPEAKPDTSTWQNKFQNTTEIFWGNGPEQGITPIYDLVDAFNLREKICKTYTNAKDGSTYTFDIDFSSRAADTHFVCFITGHLHSDNVHLAPARRSRQVVINTACTNAWTNRNADGTKGTSYPYYNELNDLARQAGTPSENALNAITIDMSNRTVLIARIGSQIPAGLGERRDYMAVTYGNYN